MMVGHIDLFKIYRDGFEFATYQDWLTADIGQILVEIQPHVFKVQKWTTGSESAGQFFVGFYKESLQKKANTSPDAKPLLVGRITVFHGIM
jgi:Methyltransferase domain